MSRDFRVCLDDMLEATGKILQYTAALTYSVFVKDSCRIEAVLFNFMIIGEAAKMVPESIRSRYPDVEWRGAAALRDIVAHHYFGLDIEKIWRIIQSDLPTLREQLQRMLAENE
jgi:uncharacterized protein with HEPN domain